MQESRELRFQRLNRSFHCHCQREKSILSWPGINNSYYYELDYKHLLYVISFCVLFYRDFPKISSWWRRLQPSPESLMLPPEWISFPYLEALWGYELSIYSVYADFYGQNASGTSDAHKHACADNPWMQSRGCTLVRPSLKVRICIYIKKNHRKASNSSRLIYSHRRNMKEEKPVMGHGVRSSNGLMTKKKTQWGYPRLPIGLFQKIPIFYIFKFY